MNDTSHGEERLTLSLTAKELAYLVKGTGFDVNSPDKDGKTPLLRAAKEAVEGKTEIVKTLVEQCGADVAIADNSGNTPLHYLSMAETTRLLLEAGADAGAKNSNGNTPLHNAVDAESVRLLLEAGADPGTKDRNKYTPLHYAKNGEIVRLLVEAGADVNAKEAVDAATPLHCAIMNGHIDVVESLIKSGADLEMETLEEGRTPLTLAVKMGKADVVDVLCKAGANMRIEDPTPFRNFGNAGLLFVATYIQSNEEKVLDTLDVLFKHGFDPRGRDEDGDTPGDFIRAMGKARVADRIDARCQELDAKDHAAAMMERARTKGMQGSRGREMTL